MKPILVTMQACGSYGEKTEIDFQKGGDFFLISGDTGSGKSTIFDAMMFALYGEVSTNGSGKENELLSQFVDVRNDKPLVSLVFTAHQHGQEETYKITRTPRHIRPAKRTGAKQQEEGETAAKAYLTGYTTDFIGATILRWDEMAAKYWNDYRFGF